MRSAVRVLPTLVLLTVATAVRADVPTEMSVQGRLTNGAGAPVPAGLKNFTFKIFDQQVGGVEIWPGGPGETQVLTTDANGLWNAGVGSVIPLTEAVFLNPVRWLEVTVDDGVNPIETLPRIELRTNPYTYRAATSQQADSLAGNSLGDISDMFVDEAADTMSGPLRIDWDVTDLDAPLEVENISNSYLPRWPTDVGTWGLAADANADNVTWNLGVAGSAAGDNTTNYGLYGAAAGSNATNIGVWGEAIGSGSGNYAGVFFGDVSVVGGSLGDPSVQLPANAISSLEMQNEPGLASSNNAVGGDMALTATMTDIETVTITTPADGYIRVVGNVYSWITGPATSVAVGGFQIDETAGGLGTIPYYRLVGSYSKGAANEFGPVCVERTYFKPAGTYTFRLEGQTVGVAGGGGVWTIWPILTAMYYPTSYGTVEAIVASSDEDSFDHAEETSVRPGSGGANDLSTPSQSFQVDLRELELRVARAEAEAQQARRELLEARMNSLRTPGLPPGTTHEESKQ